jgi:GT2 family glycosyltransferase
MLFSLVLVTLGRTTELANFLAHLERQNYRSFELILVDQSGDDRLKPVLAHFRERFALTHLRSALGLSKGRNAGIPHTCGEVIGFPDDDCWYPGDLLERLAKLFECCPEIDGFTGRIVDDSGAGSLPFGTQAGKLTRLNVWKRANSNSIFLRSGMVKKVGGFDEGLGVGSKTPWHSSEEIDYLLRCIQDGYHLMYDPGIAIIHPNIWSGDYNKLCQRAFGYGAGMGYTWKKHHYPVWFVAYHLLRPLGGIILSMAQRKRYKARFHWLSLRGRWAGWRSTSLTDR